METETNSNTYTIKTHNYEGPFNLLLHLIEEKKLHINDLSLSEVTESYLNFIKTMETLNEEEASNFIVVAATLVLIKSKSLLPEIKLTEEEEGEIKNLEDRLRQYEFYSRMSIGIKSNFGKKMIFQAIEKKSNFLVFLPDEQITKDHMMVFLEDVLGRIPKKVFLTEVEVKKVISIEEMINNLTDRIQSSLKMNFSEFGGKPKTKEEKVFLIVSFLAMLELVRGGLMEARQNSNFGEIEIEKI